MGAIILLLLLIAGGVTMAVERVADRSHWIILPAFAPLLIAIRLLPPIRAMLCGLIWGSAFFLTAIIEKYSGVPHSLASLALLSLLPGAYALCGALLTRRMGFNPYVLAVLWMVVELGLLPLGMHGGLLAGSITGSVVLGVVGKTLGYVLLAFVVALVVGVAVGAASEVLTGAKRATFIRVTARTAQQLCSQWSANFLQSQVSPSKPRAPPRSAMPISNRC